VNVYGSFEAFVLRHPPLRGQWYPWVRASEWISAPGLRLYVRRSSPHRRTDYDLATANADKPGSGAMTRFLDQYEPLYSFYLENVLEPRLVGYYLRRGYTIVEGTAHCPCLRKPKEPSCRSFECTQDEPPSS
jgi:hypothetical protein